MKKEIKMEDDIELVMDEEFEKDTVEYNLSKRIEEFTKQVPQKGAERAYMNTLSKISIEFYRMLNALEENDMKSITEINEIIESYIGCYNFNYKRE